MHYFCIFVLVNIVECVYRGRATLSCRNDDNNPVDWWYIYKPPSKLVQFMDPVFNFTYITHKHAGKWYRSQEYIMYQSMLKNTLAPMFKANSKDTLGIVVYDEKLSSSHEGGTEARGILLADEDSAVWIVHSVPDFPDLSNTPLFPEEEIANGHLMSCLTVSIPTANDIATLIRQAEPFFRVANMPVKLMSRLTEWKFDKPASKRGSPLKYLEFSTRAKSIRVIGIVRRPGDNHCIYRAFARSQKVVLDVYGQSNTEFLTSVCASNYSVRNIEGISLKFPEGQVFYIINETDRARFAVSTAASWQRTGGSGADKYWTCVSNVDKEDESGKGGILLCVNDYDIWLTFEKMKIKEPVC